MKEKSSIFRFVCSFVGLAALLIYLALTVLGNDTVFLVARIFTATIALISYTLKCVSEIVSKNKFGNSIFLMSIAILDIVLCAVQLI